MPTIKQFFAGIKGWQLLSTAVIGLSLIVSTILVQQRQIFQKKAAPTATTLTFIHQDQLGSTAMVTDATVHVVSRKVYYPYGTIRSTEGESSTERGYTGQISDTDQTGLLYYNARYYDPIIAKFTTADKAGDTLNKYAYVGNNPTVNTDPSGNMLEAGDGSGGGSGGGRKGRSKGSLGKQSHTSWQTGYNPWGSWGAGLLDEPFRPTPQMLLFTGVLSAAPVAAVGCAANPSLCGLILQAADVVIDSSQCLGGDSLSCALVTVPIPGAGWGDDVAAAARKWTQYDGTGTLIVDQATDPVLRQTIKDGVEYIGKNADDSFVRASEYVDRVLPYRTNQLTTWNPFRNTKLGKFIICGSGVCKQRAALLYEVLQAAGAPSSLIKFNFSSSMNHMAVLDTVAFQVWDAGAVYGRFLPGYLRLNKYTIERVFHPIAK